MAVPEHVSLICNDADPSFGWCKPPISHIRWDSRPVVRRVLQWADHISRGKSDLRQTLTPAEFVVGGTIGRVKE
jgi:DNA-binding LacI/PurR family transcriptional regulator